MRILVVKSRRYNNKSTIVKGLIIIQTFESIQHRRNLQFRERYPFVSRRSLVKSTSTAAGRHLVSSIEKKKKKK